MVLVNAEVATAASRAFGQSPFPRIMIMLMLVLVVVDSLVLLVPLWTQRRGYPPPNQRTTDRRG